MRELVVPELAREDVDDGLGVEVVETLRVVVQSVTGLGVEVVRLENVLGFGAGVQLRGGDEGDWN